MKKNLISGGLGLILSVPGETYTLKVKYHETLLFSEDAKVWILTDLVQIH